MSDRAMEISDASPADVQYECARMRLEATLRLAQAGDEDLANRDLSLNINFALRVAHVALEDSDEYIQLDDVAAIQLFAQTGPVSQILTARMEARDAQRIVFWQPYMRLLLGGLYKIPTASPRILSNIKLAFAQRQPTAAIPPANPALTSSTPPANPVAQAKQLSIEKPAQPTGASTKESKRAKKAAASVAPASPAVNQIAPAQGPATSAKVLTLTSAQAGSVQALVAVPHPPVKVPGPVGKALALMRNNMDRPEQVRRACATLTRVFEQMPTSASTRLDVTAIGVVELLMTVMRRYSAHGDLQRDAAMVLQHIARYSANEPGAHEFILRSGVVSLLCTAMRTHDTHTLVQHYCCGLLLNLAGSAPVRPTLATCSGVVETLVAAMKNHEVHSGVQQNASGALMYLTHQSAELRADTVEAGGIEALTEALRKHPKLMYVVQNSCGALQNITINIIEFQARALRANTVEVLVTVMQTHMSQLVIMQCACGALRNLTGHTDGRLRGSDAGAIEAVVMAMYKHTDRTLHQYCCECLQYMTSYCDAHDRAVNAGAIDALLLSLKSHPTNTSVQQYGCGALLHLAYSVPAYRARAAEAGAIELAVAALITHPTSANLLQNALGCLLNLLKHQPTASRALQANAIDIIQKTMGHHPSHQPIQQYGCEALHKLGEHASFHLSPTDHALMLSAITSAMTLHPDMLAIQAGGCETLFQLATVHPPDQPLLGDLAKALPPLIAAIAHRDSSVVVKQCAIETLAHLVADPARRQLAVTGGAIEALVSCIALRPGDTQIVKPGSTCLQILLKSLSLKYTAAGGTIAVPITSPDPITTAALAVHPPASSSAHTPHESTPSPEVQRAVSAGAMAALVAAMNAHMLENNAQELMLCCLFSVKLLSYACTQEGDLLSALNATMLVVLAFRRDMRVMDVSLDVLRGLIDGPRPSALLAKYIRAGMMRFVSHIMGLNRTHNDRDVCFQVAASLFLVHLSVHSSVRKALLADGIVNVLTITLETYLGDWELQAMASQVLVHLASTPSLRPVLGHPDVFRALLLPIWSTCSCKPCRQLANPAHIAHHRIFDIIDAPITPLASPARTAMLDSHTLDALQLLLTDCPANIAVACHAQVVPAMLLQFRRAEVDVESLYTCSRILFLLATDTFACRTMVETRALEMILGWIAVNPSDDVNLTRVLFRLLANLRDAEMRRSAVRLMGSIISADRSNQALLDLGAAIVAAQHRVDCGCAFRWPREAADESQGSAALAPQACQYYLICLEFFGLAPHKSQVSRASRSAPAPTGSKSGAGPVTNAAPHHTIRSSVDGAAGAGGGAGGGSGSGGENKASGHGGGGGGRSGDSGGGGGGGGSVSSIASGVTVAAPPLGLADFAEGSNISLVELLQRLAMHIPLLHQAVAAESESGPAVAAALAGSDSGNDALSDGSPGTGGVRGENVGVDPPSDNSPPLSSSSSSSSSSTGAESTEPRGCNSQSLDASSATVAAPSAGAVAS